MAHVLVVDDDPAVLEIVGEGLLAAGHTITSAPDAEDALAHLAGADLLLTDNRMPGLSGVELIHQARTSNPSLPVILMSGFVDQASGIIRVPFLRKPFKMKRLTTLVTAELARRPRR